MTSPITLAAPPVAAPTGPAMQFGLFVPQGSRMELAGIDTAAHWTAMLDVARLAERGPWDSLWLVDHLHTLPVATDEATYEVWALMAALAATTARIRLGQMCTCAGFRNPALLAKIAATTDVISGGRVDVGLGAGWYEAEWRAYGYDFPPLGERLGRLRESVEILHRLWTEGRATLDGRYHRVSGAVCRPLPLQRGGIPMWIAGGGEKVTLRLAARHATYTNFTGDPDGFRHKSAVLAGHCRDVGRDFATIRRSASYKVVIGETTAEVRDTLRRLRARYERLVGAEQAERICRDYASGLLVGTAEQVAERLLRMRALGLAYAMVYFPGIAHDRSGVELFSREVIPAVSGGVVSGARDSS
ncbi:TIGR03560 family F420-dependent LLM class oxidoreductase [Actinoplanes teichomyceticus]|nr:TIGR03560 family F420-dependent LLM class oxidoreductase [Actinoplanes teichomyceticus]GIF16398.1 LLM class F420-dependent oxidoreductase [Actinoplanes teichomyceticus]